uniref:Transportin-3 n=1 Tax=Strigamia maritima TaxID=126957 RepID=T1JH21_STRMM
METSLENVSRAINVLYHNPDTTAKEKASAWLDKLQQSVIAWKISDELLQQNIDIESSYFAAQTMRTKIQFSFHELPGESHHQLRDSLLQHITRIITDENNSIILTQLCLALADFALQMTSWEMSTRDLIQQMSQNIQLIPALLEIVTVLPEEVYNRSLRLGENRRNDVLDEFSQVAPTVLQFLDSCMKFYDASDDARMQSKIIKCLTSWLSVDLMNTSKVARSDLFTSIISFLGNPWTPSMIHESASDCVCAALVLIENRRVHKDLTRVLFDSVHALIEPYHLSLTANDADKCSTYCRVFTEFAESFLDDIIENPDRKLGSLHTLDVILKCLESDDYEMAEITFNFWYGLAEKLERKCNENLNNLFAPYIEKLISGLCRLCRLQSDSSGIIEDDDDFSDFRMRISDLMKDVVVIVGSLNCFRKIFNDLGNQASNATWNMSESSLFVMSTIAKDVCLDEIEIVPKVINAILNLSDETHIAVRFTSIRLIGEFCDWVDKHPQTLEPILNFLLKCLRQRELSTVAAAALLNICSACTYQMGFHFDGLLHIIRNKQLFNISDEAAISLFKGSALILAKMSGERIHDGAMKLCEIPAGQLFQGINSDESVRIDPATSLDCLTVIFRHQTNLDLSVKNGQTHPCIFVIQQVWPIVFDICVRFQHDVRIVEKCCKCIRFMIRCVGRQLTPLIEQLVDQIVKLYGVHQHSCYLYLGSVLVDEYGEFQECHKGLIAMLEAFCGPTFLLMDGVDNLRSHPDTVEDLFRLCIKLLQNVTALFLQSSMFKSIFQCALAACALDHQDAISAVVKFFYELIRCQRIESEARSFLVECLDEFGASLMNNLIKACIFGQATFMIRDVADVIYELVVYDRGLACFWLENSLRILPSSGIGASQEQLSRFHKAVTGAGSKGDVFGAIRVLGRLYR